MLKKKFKINGMHCNSCALNIDFDLEDLDGVSFSKTSYVKNDTEVEFDEGKVSLEEIFKAVEKLGYKPSD